MFTWIKPLPVGNAVRLIVTPPKLALKWRVLRRTTDAFTGHDDAGAVLVSAGQDNAILDVFALVNGVQYFYRAYWFDGLAWHIGGQETVTPAASYWPEHADVLTLVRDRFADGLKHEVSQGRLIPATGKIPVNTAPPQFENTPFPVVTAQLESDACGEQFLGDMADLDQFNEETGEWVSSEGALFNTKLSIVGWSLNPDERLELRKSIRNIWLANREVFAGLGLFNLEFSQSDSEDFQSYGAPVYLSTAVFTCQSVAAVASGGGMVIADVLVTTD